MNAPVTTALPAVRPAAPRASESGRSHSAAPFASALDGALTENRTHASDRGPDRRGTPEERTARAEERDAATDQRIDDRTRAAERRADDKAARIDARAHRAAEHAAEKAARDTGTDAVPATPVDDATPPGEVAPETEDATAEDAGKSTEAPRGGLPALWALLMGSAPATTPPAETSTDTDAAVPGLPGLPGLPGAPVPDAAGTGIPVPVTPATGLPADATVDTSGITSTAPAGAAPATPSTGTAAPAAPVATGGEGLPAAFSAVLAETGAVVTTSAGPGTPGGVAPTTVGPAAPAPALPVELVLDAASTAGPSAPAAVPTVVPAPAPVPVPVPVPVDGDAEPAAVATGPASTGSVGAPADGRSGQALSADAGDAGQPGSDDAAPVPGTSGQTTIGPAASVVTPTVAAVAEVDGATGAAATLPVGAQVARQVAVLSGGPDGEHSMTLVLTPDTLGEVQVQVTLTKGSIELALRGAHEHGRAALLDALPELRRELEAAGLNPSRVEVARDSGGSWLDRQPTPQQGFGERGGQHNGNENRSRPWGRPADIGGSGSPTANRSTSSGVDVRV